MRLAGEKIKNLCRKRNLKLKDLLRKAHVSPTAYYSLLRKDSVLPHSLRAIARVLNISPAEFLEDTTAEHRRVKLLLAEMEHVLEAHSEAERDNVWHTLLMLETKPLQRLRKGLLRARHFDFHK